MATVRSFLRAMALIMCALATMITPEAYADTANPNAKSKLASPINLDGFGAPLPAVAKSGPDLATFAAGQINFKQIQTVP